MNNWFGSKQLKIGYFRGKVKAYQQTHDDIYEMAMTRLDDFEKDPVQTLTQLLAVIRIHKDSAERLLKKVQDEDG